MIEFFIAKKHIMERKKQSFLSILGIIIGITVLTVAVSINNGLNNNMINSILNLSPHITVANNGFFIEDYNSYVLEIEKIKGVKGVVPTFTNQGILKSDNDFGSYSTGVQIQGMDLEKAEKAMKFDKILIEGKIENKQYNKVLIGSELFDQLGLKIGEEVELTSAENKKIKLIVGAVFKSGSQQVDNSLIILPLITTQFLSDSGDVVRSIDIMLDNPYDAPNIIPFVSDIVKEFRARTWGEINSTLLKALNLEKTVGIVLFSLIIVIAGFVVGVVLHTMVREKTKDIGILRAMGYSKNTIMRIFLLEGALLGLIGIIVGISLSYFIMHLLKIGVFDKLTDVYYLTAIPVEISFGEVSAIVLSTAFVILISSVFPSYKASKLTPVEALKYE